MMRRRGRSTREAHIEDVYVANAADLLSYFGRRAMVPADAADLLTRRSWWHGGEAIGCRLSPEQARMWLFGVARRVRANAARGAARESDLTDKLRAHLEALPTEHVDAETLDIRAALDAISDNQSELVRLVLWDGFTLPEAATILGISESTARGRYQRARIQLRELLLEHQYERNAP